MKRLFLAMAAVASLGTALPAAAQFAKPEDAVKYRKAAFTVMATHFGRIGAMVSGKAPFDAAAAAANADTVATMSKLPYAGFVEGTGGTEKGSPKANVWTERDKFNAAATKMQDEMVKLNAAAKTGDVATIKAAAGGVGQACKGCHDNYRKE